MITIPVVPEYYMERIVEHIGEIMNIALQVVNEEATLETSCAKSLAWYLIIARSAAYMLEKAADVIVTIGGEEPE